MSSSSSLISTPKQKGVLYLASSLCDGLEDNDLRQVTTLLKSKEADPNVLMPCHGITPFHLVIGNDSEAFAEEVTKLFLRHGGNPNVESVDGMTPVHVAAAWGRTKILDLLLANGGDPLHLDEDCCTPFHYAFQGEHFEAVSILSKYCINCDDDDDKPKFKRELDKVLVNNGDVLAEYIVSDDPSFDSSYTNSSFSSNNNSKTNTSGYVPENSSRDGVSINSDFVTMRRRQRKRLTQQTGHVYNNNINERNFDFKRETMEEEKHLINEIISRLSSSIASDAEASNGAFQNYEDDSSVSCKTSSPKRKQITMTFNRASKCNDFSKLSEKQSNNRRSTTLQVIKQHNNLPHLKNNRILTNNLKKPTTNLDKSLVSKKNTQSLIRKVTPSKSKHQTVAQENALHLNKWLDETIISKSPNLAINSPSQEKKKKLYKTSNFAKKASPMYTKVSQKSPVITPSKVRTRSPNKLNNCLTPTSRIPRPKKYFTTPCSVKTVKRSIETPTRTVIPNKRKPDSSKRTATTERPKKATPLNRTYSKSEASTPSQSTDNEQSQKCVNNRESFRNIAMNLDDRIYDNDEEDAMKEKNLHSSIVAESKPSANTYVSTFEKELAKIFSGSEFISGVGMLESGIISKSYSKSSSNNKNINKEEETIVSQDNEMDLNRAIMDSLTSLESKEDNIDIDNVKNNRFDKSNDDSLLCSKGSVSSDSSGSFLSLTKPDDHPNGYNNIYRDRKVDVKPSISPESNLISLKDDSSSSYRKFDSETFVSMEEEYKYEDAEEGVIFLERRLCVTPPCASSDLNTSFYSCSTAKSEPLPREMFLLDNVTLRERLKNLGENPGPITNTTHHLYLKRLHRLESQGRKPIRQNDIKNTHPRNSVNLDSEKELLKSSLLSIEWIKNLDDFEALEQKVFQEFVDPSPSRKWREGTTKSSFNYLLLDPRITKDLPRRAANLSMSEKWQIFLSAIFYVGKGKRSRPYAHLYDAFKIWVSKDEQSVTNKKIQRILDIWNEDKGVIVLHVFQNTIPVEAYTREAMMIEVLGTQKLGNCKAGDYYGVATTWRSREKCELGRYLLFKALQIMLLEGERQIFPQNL